jgi:predicted HD superfamily hydrolase involved in NAD metabolism
VTPSWETALAALGERLDERGVRHSTGVAAMAERLARTYGLDVDSARLAGLLHDWCKDVSGEELLGRAEALGIPVTDADRAVPYLLHAPVAARELKDAAHTYGSSTLTPLDMAVYVADTLEPGRTHAGVEELRALIGSVSLDELFALAYADSLRHLVDSRRRIHPETVATWNRIVGGEGR